MDLSCLRDDPEVWSTRLAQLVISKTGWVDMQRIISLGYLECFE
jgi:hypothetical protein